MTYSLYCNYAHLLFTALVVSTMSLIIAHELLQLRANDVLVVPTSVLVALHLRTLFSLEACVTPLASVFFKRQLDSYRVNQVFVLVLALAALVGQGIINWNSLLLTSSFDDKFCEARLRGECTGDDSPPIAGSLRRPDAPGLVLSPRSDAIASIQAMSKTQLECMELLLLLNPEMPQLGAWEGIVKSVNPTNETDAWCKRHVRNASDASFAADNAPSTAFGPEIKSIYQLAKWMSIALLCVMVMRGVMLYNAVTASTESPVAIVVSQPEERKMELLA
ncbi:hypothetical protein Poli38472_001161 [Pythium oligandrum]|uniref:Uncharacterized protein n=1 Tax=Pythium oligandrum TaxID=41045 RepID=A0A8K1CUP3_PYTOL|nr:hypothetical protein Poli38472_001161 [Pythium oligandrum]|eukprot:TMW69005.1 hypothetical protein Poli38472_001161 [Pythium oligandrum]